MTKGRGSDVDQSRAKAGRDVIGRDKITVMATRATVIEKLLKRLEYEIETKEHVRETITRLQRYYEKKADDGVEGLENKLVAANRRDELLEALEQKELFAMALEKWSLYASAQQIFAHLLARAEHEFRMNIYPQISCSSPHAINVEVTKRIVEPTVDDCGATVFEMDHRLAMGMLYWLAEQCFIRWH